MIETIVTFGLLGVYLLFLLADVLWPARAFPTIRRWRAKGLLFFVLYIALSTAAPLFWDEHLARYRLVDLTSLGIVGGAIVGFLVLDLAVYAWHRTLHRVPFLWRWFHQMHHSAERIDIWGAFYFSPLDMIGFTFVGSLSLVWIVGIPAESAILANGLFTFISVFQHANVRTPQWLGLFVLRPENHSVHHERGLHAHNFGGLAIWDMLFGTYHNPSIWEGVGGFWDGASHEVGAMLLGRDIAEPTSPEERGPSRPSFDPAE